MSSPHVVLHEASVKSGWPLVPLWSVARRVDRTGRPDAELLSVYRDHGVVRKSDRDDNWNQESEDLSTYKYVEPGDLVLNKMKTWQGSLAVSEYEGIVSPAYFTCTLAESVHPRFIHYLLRSTPYIALYGAASKGIRPGQWDLPFEAFRALPVLLPPLDVQRRVADFLDDQIGRIDSIISARGRQIADLTRSVESLAWGEVTAANQPGERKASGVAWCPSIPVGWGAPRISLVARMGTGHTPSRSEPGYWRDCSIPWLTTADVHRFRADGIDVLSDTEHHISALGLANSAAVLHPAGTVALSRTASAGFAIMLGVDAATSQDYATWTPGPTLDGEYLLWCLRTMRRDILGRLATGSTHKTIYFPDLASIRIPLPPLADQVRIVSDIKSGLGSIRNQQELMNDSLGALKELKRSLISAAVSGEFDVTTSDGSGARV